MGFREKKKKKGVSKNVSASIEKPEQRPNWKCVNEALIFTILNEEWHKFHVGVKVLEVKQSETFFSPWCEQSSTAAALSDCQRLCFSPALSEKKKKSQLMIYLFLFIVCFFFFFPDKSRFIVALSQFFRWRNVRRRSGWKRRGTAPLKRFGKFKKINK